LKNYINNAEALETINTRIYKVESEIISRVNPLFENYTIILAIWMKNWIIMNPENKRVCYQSQVI
jgi:hypothetical protein